MRVVRVPGPAAQPPDHQPPHAPAWSRRTCHQRAGTSADTASWVPAACVADTPSLSPVPQSHGVCRSTGLRSRPDVAISDVTAIGWTDHTFNPWWGEPAVF